MHRLSLAVLACLTVGLLGASPLLIGTPSVVVYPFTSTASDIDREANSKIATLIAQRIATDGGVNVLPPKPGIERQDYLSEARKQNADYYVTGFLSPLGGGASIVEQLVSAQTGVVIFSNSAQLSVYNDSVAQGDILRNAIIRHAQRNLSAYDAPPAAPAATPSPAADSNLGSGLLGKRATPAGPRTYAVLAINGSASADERTLAAQAIATSIERSGNRGLVLSATAPAAGTCTSNAVAILGGWLDTPADAAGQATKIVLRLIGYDCNGKTVFDRSFEHAIAGAPPAAVVAALADTAIGSYLHPSKKR